MRKIWCLLLVCVFALATFTSCGSFGEGVLMGLAQTSAYMAQPRSTYSSSPSFVYNPTPTTFTYTPSASVSSYNSSSSGTSSSTTTTSSSSSSQKICKKVSATDNAHCNGSGVCSKCNGKGKYYDSSFGISRWVDPCTTCGGSGKCPSCHGTGHK